MEGNINPVKIFYEHLNNGSVQMLLDDKFNTWASHNTSLNSFSILLIWMFLIFTSWGFFFSAKPVFSKFCTHILIACVDGTWSWCSKLKWWQNCLSTISTLSLFLWNSLMFHKTPILHHNQTTRWWLLGFISYSVLPIAQACQHTLKNFLFLWGTLYYTLQDTKQNNNAKNLARTH